VISTSTLPPISRTCVVRDAVPGEHVPHMQPCSLQTCRLDGMDAVGMMYGNYKKLTTDGNYCNKRGHALSASCTSAMTVLQLSSANDHVYLSA
jgi:hypothetical protein